MGIECQDVVCKRDTGVWNRWGHLFSLLNDHHSGVIVNESIDYDTRMMVIQQREQMAPSTPDAIPNPFLNEADTADAKNKISAFTEKCNSPFKSKTDEKLHEFTDAKKDVISIALVRRDKPTEDIPTVDGHPVEEEREYAPHNPAGPRFGKGADLAVLLKSDGEPAVDLPPGYMRVENSDRQIILSA